MIRQLNARSLLVMTLVSDSLMNLLLCFFSSKHETCAETSLIGWMRKCCLRRPETPPDEHEYIPVYVSRSQYTFEGVGHQRRVISCSTRASHPLIRGNDQSLALSTTWYACIWPAGWKKRQCSQHGVKWPGPALQFVHVVTRAGVRFRICPNIPSESDTCNAFKLSNVLGTRRVALMIGFWLPSANEVAEM